MKRSLPTLGRGSAQAASATWVPPTERRDPGRPVVAIAHLAGGDAQARLAATLIAGLTEQGVQVAALLGADELEAESQTDSALSSLRRAGAEPALLVRPSMADPHSSVAQALQCAPPDALVVAVGGTLPLFHRTFFTVVVGAQRPPLTAAKSALARHADLLLPMAAECIVGDLARLLGARFSQSPHA